MGWDVGAFPLETPRGGVPPAFSNRPLPWSVSRIDLRCNVKPELRITKVGTKGQIVIPNELRAALKLEVGDAMIVQLEGTRIVLERRRTVILSLVGKYSQPLSRPASNVQHSEERDPSGA